MEDRLAFERALGVFAHYGFRKSSMEDLAQAVGVSRQTLYNRLKTKEAVLDWAVEGWARASGEDALAELRVEGRPAAESLLQVFSRLIGDVVPLLRGSPHGAEIMDMGTESMQRSNIDPHGAVEADLTRFLVDRQVCATPVEAEDITYLLLVAAKGLLLKCETSEAFQEGMARIIRTALPG